MKTPQSAKPRNASRRGRRSVSWIGRASAGDTATAGGEGGMSLEGGGEPQPACLYSQRRAEGLGAPASSPAPPPAPCHRSKAAPWLHTLGRRAYPGGAR